MMVMRKKATLEEDEGATSFESFSSPSKSSGHLHVRSSTSSSLSPFDGSPSDAEKEGKEILTKHSFQFLA